MNAAAAGAEVCHVDAARGMVAWARENAKSSGVEKICAEEMERRIGLAERALGKFPGTADKLLEFCAAMRELALG